MKSSANSSSSRTKTSPNSTSICFAPRKDPNEKETIARAFRTLHTVKGTAGFLGLEKLQAVSHAAENLLSKVDRAS